MNKKVNETNFWEEKYLTGYIPWDINTASPAFVKYFNKRPGNNSSSKYKVAVLGCGRGHDAFYLSKESSFEVYGFDFSKQAIDFCKKIKEEKSIKIITFHNIDFFELIKDKKWKNYFDYVIEHTSFCAINPNRRKEYIELIKYLLKPSGRLVGLFFMRSIELGGPPFGSTLGEVRELLKEDFVEEEKLHYAECLHTGKLNGDEYFGVFKKLQKD